MRSDRYRAGAARVGRADTQVRPYDFRNGRVGRVQGGRRHAAPTFGVRLLPNNVAAPNTILIAVLRSRYIFPENVVKYLTFEK